MKDLGVLEQRVKTAMAVRERKGFITRKTVTHRVTVVESEMFCGLQSNE